jgi:hypothetical protein
MSSLHNMNASNGTITSTSSTGAFSSEKSSDASEVEREPSIHESKSSVPPTSEVQIGPLIVVGKQAALVKEVRR